MRTCFLLRFICFLESYWFFGVVLGQTPNQQFRVDGPSALCPGECGIYTISPSPNSANASYNYYWSNGAIGRTVEICEPGTYFIKIEGQGGFTYTHTFQILEIPSGITYIIAATNPPCNDSLDANSISKCQKVCPNTTITYYANTSGSISSYFGWQVAGDAQHQISSNGKTIQVTWGAAGSGMLQAFPTPSQNNCSVSQPFCVTIVEPPKAKISSIPAPQNGKITVCKGQNVIFKNESSNADIFEWTLGDGNASNEAAPQMTFSESGTYHIRLAAHSSCLCSDTANLVVEVLDVTAPNLDCVGTVCPNEVVTYSASGDCAGYVWSIGGSGSVEAGGTPGSSDITIRWSDGASGSIQLLGMGCATNNCPIPSIFNIPIVSDAAKVEGKTNVCPGSFERYRLDNFSGTNFQWKISSGGKITVGQNSNEIEVEWDKFLSGNNTTHWISVNYENCYLGCRGSDSLPVRIVPSFFVQGATEFCADLSGQFLAYTTHNNQPLTCHWMLKNSSNATVWQSASPATQIDIPFLAGAGRFEVVARPANPMQVCTEEASRTVFVRARPDRPTTVLGERDICPNEWFTYQIPNLPAGTPVEWTVKNGASAPQILKGNPLNFQWGNSAPRWLTAQIISRDGLACRSDSELLEINAISTFEILGKPTVCLGEISEYQILNYPDRNFQWQIIPATAGSFSEKNSGDAVKIFWQQPGIHQIVVKYCGQTVVQQVEVRHLPNPQVLHPLGVCPGNLATLAVSQSFEHYFWKNESGTTISTSAQPMLGAGNFLVEVEDNLGCRGNATFKIETYPVPIAKISTSDPTGFCQNSKWVNFQALTDANSHYQFQWLHDGAAVGTNLPNFSTNQYGNFAVQVTNQHGCAATSPTILVFEYCGGGGSGTLIPGAGSICPSSGIDLSVISTLRCDSFLLENATTASFIPNSTIWNFWSEGGTGLVANRTGEQINVVLPDAGWFLVQMIIETSPNQFCYIIDSLKVKAKANFNASISCPGEFTAFDDLSNLMPGEQIVAWAWNFGNPASGSDNFSNLQKPNHRYFLGGNYVVELTITTASGCQSVVKKTIEIPDFPQFSLQIQPQTCVGTSTAFQFQHTGTAPTSIFWQFGNAAAGTANFSTAAVAFHTFSTDGFFNVSLTLGNIFGCTSTQNQVVEVIQNQLSGNILAVPDKFCHGGMATLSAPTAQNYQWSNGAITPNITTFLEDIFSVTISNSAGCTFSPPAVPVEVLPSPDVIIKAILKNQFGQTIGMEYPTLSICEGEDVFLAAFTQSNVNYNWISHGGTSSTKEFSSVRGNLLPVGEHVFVLQVTDKVSGCTQTANFVVKVHPRPLPFAIVNPQQPACAGVANVINLIGSPQNQVDYQWNTGKTGTSLTTQLPGTYFLRATNPFGCSRESNRVVVKTGPKVDVVPSGCHHRCRPDTLCFPILPNIVDFQWFFNGIPLPSGNQPTLIAQHSGTYFLKMTDADGCTATSPPLNLELQDGFGSIFGKVWADVNQNNLIDAADTLVSGVQFFLENATGQVATATSLAGNFSFPNFLAENYTIRLASGSLPSGWVAVWQSQNIEISGCNVLKNVQFLIKKGCTASSQLLNFETCAGSTIQFAGVEIAAGESRTFNFTSTTGCDSTIYVAVASLPHFSQNVNFETCAGSTIQFAGVEIAAGESKTFHFTTTTGCDSTIYVAVASLPHFVSQQNLKICPGEKLDFNGQKLEAGNTYTFHFLSREGCDSTVILRIESYESIDFQLFTEKSCTEKPTGKLWLGQIQGNAAPYLLSLNGVNYTSNFEFSDLAAGDFLVKLKDANGCIFEKSARIDARLPLKIELPSGKLPCDGSGVLLQPKIFGDQQNLSWQWSDGTQTVENQIFEEKTLIFKVQNECEKVEQKVEVTWSNESLGGEVVFVPNVFSPTSLHPSNQVFRGFVAENVEVLNYEMKVFDRWGELIFVGKSPEEGWSGAFRTEAGLQPAVVVYLLEMQVRVCGREFWIKKQGDCTILR